MFLSFDNNTSGTVGIAWVGSVCADKTFRTSVSEWFVSDASTGQVDVCRLMENLEGFFKAQE